MAVDQALLQFIDGATSGSREALPKPADQALGHP
jgi:hypothetical protein